MVDRNEYTPCRRRAENRGHGLDPFVQVDAYPIVPGQTKGLQTSRGQARRTPKLGIAHRYIAEGQRGRPAALIGHLLQEVVQIRPHGWLRSRMNRSNSSSIGEINKRATTIVDARSTLGIAKQFSLVFP